MTTNVRRSWRAFPAALATLAIAMTGCGIPLDDTPRAVLATTTSIADNTATSVDEIGEGGASTAFLFFAANNLLINLDEEIPSRQPRDVLDALFAGVPTGASPDVISQIPTGTRLLGVEQNGGRLDVDVSAEFDNVVGASRSQATAQIVMTATDLPGIDEVALRIEGEPTQVFSPVSGDTDSVGACDYLILLPTDDVIAAWSLDRKSQRHLTTRRNMLAGQCVTPSGG